MNITNITGKISKGNKLFGNLGGSINILRNTLSPMRNYFASVAAVYYKHIENFTIGLFYSMHKFRTLMNRTLSGFSLMYHTVEHTKNTLSSVAHSRQMKRIFNFGQDVIDVGDAVLVGQWANLPSLVHVEEVKEKMMGADQSAVNAWAKADKMKEVAVESTQGLVQKDLLLE